MEEPSEIVFNRENYLRGLVDGFVDGYIVGADDREAQIIESLDKYTMYRFEKEWVVDLIRRTK